jgi:NodT family efflux transporter outer membrane factor (OMF) lipoprotein
MPRKIPVFALLLSLCGCTVGPNYQRPKLATPAQFRAPEPLPSNEAFSLADLKWFELFHDERLQALIKTALIQNYDLRDAVARVEEARANLGITRSNQFPQFGASGGAEFNRFSRGGAEPIPAGLLPSQNRTFGEASLNLLSFEVDLWGRLRRATEAARANLLSADETRKTVITTLVSDVATSYLTLRELDYELEISNRTLQTRQQSLDLTKSRQLGGVGTLLDLRQAEQLVDTAAQTIPVIQQQIEQTENQIHLLLGEPPGPVERGQSLAGQEIPPDVPAGLTSALLERRPDIRAAEQTLIAANAEIGVARAAYFPQLTLSGFLGGQSTQLASLFSGSHTAFNLAPQLAQPIFTAGRLRSNVRLTEAQREEALVQYEKTIQTAFSEVSNSLIAHQYTRQSRSKQEDLVYALQDRLRLAYIRYRGGVDTQLDALDADRDLFTAELSLSQIRLQEVLTVVQLYKALGGGWQ